MQRACVHRHSLLYLVRMHTTTTVLLVEPTTFGFDEETATDNVFQHHVRLQSEELRARALEESHALADTLTEYGIRVVTFVDKPTPVKPDALFPNNWLSTWGDGRAYVYPMAAETRRRERSSKLIEGLAQNFIVDDIVDLTEAEQQGQFLESTGAMVFDHEHKIAYACISIRCDEQAFRAHCTALGYRPVTFHAADANGVPIYHTNVLMGVQRTTAVVCLAAITDKTERETVAASLRETGHEIIDITFGQLLHFCGNVLEVRNQRNEHFLILSQTAYDSFDFKQRARLRQDKILLPVAVPTVEQVGGGSVRCMLAEVFLHARPNVFDERGRLTIQA